MVKQKYFSNPNYFQGPYNILSGSFYCDYILMINFKLKIPQEIIKMFNCLLQVTKEITWHLRGIKC